MLLTAFMILLGALLGCGDSDDVPSLLTPIESIVTDDFIAGAPDINTSRPILRVFYVEPQSQPIPPTDADYRGYVNRIDQQVKEVQMFFSKEMTRHGYKGKTFAIQTHQNGKLMVERIKSDNPLAHYLDEHPHAISGEIGSRLGNIFDHSRREIRLFFVDLPGVGACGFGSGSSPNGAAWVFGGCWTNETIAHELGHAFGLQHDWRNGEFIMSYGSTEEDNGDWVSVEHPKSKLSRGAAGWLNLHPAFTGREDNLLMYGLLDNFRVVSAEKSPNSNTHVMHVVFNGEYFPQGHDLHEHSLNSIIHYAVFLDTTDWNTSVIRYLGNKAIKHKIVSGRKLGDRGPEVFNHIEYEMRFEAQLPHDLQRISMQFMSKFGHDNSVTSIDWTP